MQYTLYDYLPSGNGYKVRLTAKHLKIPYRLVEVVRSGVLGIARSNPRLHAIK